MSTINNKINYFCVQSNILVREWVMTLMTFNKYELQMQSTVPICLHSAYLHAYTCSAHKHKQTSQCMHVLLIIKCQPRKRTSTSSLLPANNKTMLDSNLKAQRTRICFNGHTTFSLMKFSFILNCWGVE